MTVARNHIENIRRTEFQLGDDGRPKTGIENLLRRMNDMAEQLSLGLYERDCHFIFELIQNAEDNDYERNVTPTLRFELSPADVTGTPNASGCLWISNNERGFEEANIEAICNFNRSTKKGGKASGYIGEKGIGFKSVFVVSERPHIFSNGYQIHFLEKDEMTNLGFVIPYWIESPPVFPKDHPQFSTTIALPLKVGQYEKIKTELENFSAETILFLSRLHRIQIVIESRETIIERDDDGNVATITTLVEDAVESSHYWLQRKTFDVPNKVIEEKRAGILHREIAVAFPLNGPNGDERMFAYLPTEQRPGWPFLVNADFLLTASREDVRVDLPWNQWLIGSVSEVAFEGVLALTAHSTYRLGAYQFIPRVTRSKTSSYGVSVARDLVDRLSKSECVLGDDDRLHLPKEVFFASDELRKLCPPGDRSSWFQANYLVNAGISEFPEQLRSIGVKDTNKTALRQIFSDAVFLNSRDVAYYLPLYEFLRESLSVEQIGQLPIVPVDAQPNALGAEAVYRARKAGNGAPVLQKLPVRYLSGIKFLNPTLQGLLEEHASLEKWTRESLGVRQFSVALFICNELLGVLEDELTTLEPSDLKAAIRFVLENWATLKKEDRLDELKRMPVLLASSESTFPDELSGRVLVVPRAFDKELGWQRVLVADEEVTHLAVLDDWYCQQKFEVLKDYFELIDATSTPAPREIDVDIVSTLRNREMGALYGGFFESAGRSHNIKTPVAPNLLNEGKELTERSRQAFVAWLKGVFADQGSKLKVAMGTYFYRTYRAESVQSAFYATVIRAPWVKSTKGVLPPREVFVKDAALQSIFRNSLPYLRDELPEKLIDFVGINRGATTETVLKYLSSLRVAGKSEKPAVVEIYRYLSNYGKDLRERFSEEALILVETPSGSRWSNAAEVIWKDASVVAGDTFGWLEKTFPANLRDFFVQKVGVKETLDSEAYARAWLREQTRGKVDDDTRALMTEAIVRLNAECRLDERPEWLTEFAQRALVLTQGDRWVPARDVLVPDEPRLKSAFEDEVESIWRPEGTAFARLAPLTELLGVKRMSQEVQYSISPSLRQIEKDQATILTERSKLLLCYAAANLADDEADPYERMSSTGALERFLRGHEIEVAGLSVEVHLPDHFANVLQDGVAAFFQETSGTLYMNSSLDEADVIDEAAEQISRLIWGRDSKRYEDTVRSLLGIRDEERFRKLRDKKDWHLAKDRLSFVTALLKSGRAQRSEETDNDLPEGTVDEQDVPDHSLASTEKSGPMEANVSAPDSGLEGALPPDKTPKHEGRREPKGARGKRAFDEPGNDRIREPRPALDLGKPEGRSPSMRISRSRSGEKGRDLSRIRRNRMVSYVASELADRAQDPANEATQKFRKELGDKAELIVLNDLVARGYEATRQPAGNPGFDIEAIDPGSGELFYVEVKGDANAWSEKGVALSQKQYELGSRLKTGFIVAVVDRLTEQSPRVTYLRDPISYITEYRFDSNWSLLATDLPRRSGAPEEDLVASLAALTQSPACKQIIALCNDRHYPLPEVGIELANEKGVVQFDEMELAWQEEGIGVVLTEEQAIAARACTDWEIIVASNTHAIVRELETRFESM